MAGPAYAAGARRRLLSGEVVFSLAMLALSATVWWASLDLPPAMLEPIGPAAFPRAASIILALLAAIVLAGALIRPSAPSADAAGFRRRPMLALSMVALTIVYLGAMEVELLGFRDSTVIYLLALGMILFDLNWRRLPYVAAIALIIGVGAHYIFTGMFFIDLP